MKEIKVLKTDIIFQYAPNETNWLNPEWRRAKINETKKNNIMFIENNYPELTSKQKARAIGMTVYAYRYWKYKFNLQKRRMK